MKYIQNMKDKTPHERRQHAMRVSSILTAGIFTAWLLTLGVRMAYPATFFYDFTS